MLRSFFKRQKRRRDQVSSGPGQSNISAPSLPSDGPTRPATTPSISFSFRKSRSKAGRDIGSKNIVQQGEGTKIAFGDGNQVHVHTESNDNTHKAVLSRIKEKLGSYIVQDAMLTKDTHGVPSVCYQNTRTGLLDDILSWVHADKTTHTENAIDISNHTFCIEGAPGSGKSTIMNTMVIKLLEEAQRQEPGLITAHYMIRRRLQTTMDADKVLPTLLYQLASRSPELAHQMKSTLDSIPHTGVLPDDLQIRLFLDTIEGFHDKVFIIVDALDESSHPDRLAATLSPIVRQPPRNLRLLLATRNEHDVLASLGDDLIPKIVRSIPTQKSYDEVSAFIASRLRNGVEVIFRSSPRWAEWPSASQIRDLAERADGLYIWATTAVDFILSQVKRRGLTERDRWIKEVGRIGQGTKNVDALYLFILRSYVQEYEENERCTTSDRMKRFLGLIVTAEYPLALDDMIALLDLANFDPHRFVEMVRSILVPGTDPIIESTLPQVHKTFFDFITSDRAAEFELRLQDLHHAAAERCFSLMEARLHFNICELRSPFDLNRDDLVASVPKGLVYASTSWWHHLKNTHPEHLSSMMGPIRTLLCENLLFWLEIVSVAGKSLEAQGWMSELEDWLAKNWPTANAGDLGVNPAKFSGDASELIKEFKECIARSIPHIYISLPAFSPKDSIVAAHYRSRVARMVIPHPFDIPPHWESWGNHSRMMERHHISTWSISFSPCGCHLATGYYPRSVRIWDVESGECILGPLMGHEDVVYSVCFSPNGLLLATGSWDQTVCVWSVKTGHCILGPLTGHTDHVSSVSFSPDSTRIASGSDDFSIRIWDARSGECVLGPLLGHTSRIRRVSYSPNGLHIASCSDDGTIRLWDAQSGQCILDIDLPKQSDDGILSICYSPDGGRLVSSSWEGTLRIWDTQTGTCTHGPLAGHTDGVYCVCFSPDGRYIASGSDDRTIRIWDAEKAECAIGPIGGAAGGIFDVAFSPNGNYLAASSHDGTVRLWDFSSLLRTGLGAGDGAGGTKPIRIIDT